MFYYSIITGLFSLVGIPSALILLFVTIRVVLLTIRKPRRPKSAAECGNCEYSIAGLETMICPECGADLRNVGIITLFHTIKRRGRPVLAILSLGYLLAFFGTISAGVFIAYALDPWGMGGMAASAGSRTRQSVLTTSSPAIRNILYESTWDWGSNAQPTTIHMEVRPSDGGPPPFEIAIDPAMLTFVARTSQDQDIPMQTSGAYTARSLARVFAEFGLDVEGDPALADDLSDLTRMTDVVIATPHTDPSSLAMLNSLTVSSTNYLQGPATSPMAQNSFVSSLTVAGVAYLAIAVCLALWIGGSVYIVSRRRKLLREATPSLARVAST